MGMTSTIDVLLDARALLARREGWIQGMEAGPRELGGNAYCLQGAISAAEDSMQVWSSGARARVESAVDRPIPFFNDAPTTTQADVLAAIDRAIQAEWRREPMRQPSQMWRTAPSVSRHLQTILERVAESGPDAIIIPFPDRRDERRRSRSSN
jgi:hypothetical protein